MLNQRPATADGQRSLQYRVFAGQVTGAEGDRPAAAPPGFRCLAVAASEAGLSSDRAGRRAEAATEAGTGVGAGCEEEDSLRALSSLTRLPEGAVKEEPVMVN